MKKIYSMVMMLAVLMATLSVTSCTKENNNEGNSNNNNNNDTIVVVDKLKLYTDAFKQGLTSAIKKDGATYNLLNTLSEYVDNNYTQSDLERMFGTDKTAYLMDLGEKKSLSEDKKKEVIKAWLMAMLLSEIDWKNQSELYSIATADFADLTVYGDKHKLFEYAPTSDPYLLRTYAEVLYAKFRGENYSTIQKTIETCRSEINKDGYDDDSDLTNGEETTKYDADGNKDSNGSFSMVTLDRMQKVEGVIYPDATLFVPDGYYDVCAPMVNVSTNRYEEDNAIIKYVYATYDYTVDPSISGENKERAQQAIRDLTLSPIYATKIAGEIGINIPTSNPSESNTPVYHLMTYCYYPGDDIRDGIVDDPGRCRPAQYSTESGFTELLAPIGDACYASKDGCNNTLGDVNVNPGECENPSNRYHNAYPSGHSSRMWNEAMLLIELYPQKYADIAKRFYDYSQNRVVTRWHWESDVIIGRLIGGTVLPKLHTYQKFNQMFSNVRNSR